MTIVFTSFFFIFAMAGEANAKRLGGGGGFGKSQKTSQFQNSTQKKQATTNNAANQSSKKGLLGGLLGGLLAGGLIAALLGSGAFEGLQMMDMLMIAAIAFIAFKVLRGLKARSASQGRPAFAAAGQGAEAGQGNSNNQQRQAFEMSPENSESNQSQSSTANSSAIAENEQVPFNMPEGFDQAAFIEGSLEHYRTVQNAWNSGELDVIETYVSPEIFAALKQQRDKLMVAPQTEVTQLSAEIVRADQTGDTAEISILFRGVCKDVLEKSEDGIFDTWHLERDISVEGASWIIVGIQTD
ncbi:Tim44 domain-containing protein [Pelagibaculum spongiae]|uniref:Preprotein translocase subunit Tim44 n=1 Tax=Pelagibaculum spongiae TaxID=2080658 RepID=A0A2V1GSR5_9GAMM|nr:Tim44-like domain-containing protein [Pelagibaculum spongiae]PVZ66416.1 preprotein translocase subunit Tim44 [Pelagibaculum spongiae]